MRVLFTAVLAVWLCFSGAAMAAPPQAPKLPQAPSLEQRVESLEQQLAGLQATVAAGCPCNQSAAVAAAPVQGQWACGPNGCRLIRATPSAPTPFRTSGVTFYGSAPVGDFIYDPDSGSGPAPSGGGCASGTCGTGSASGGCGVGGTRQRWHLFGRPHVR